MYIPTRRAVIFNWVVTGSATVFTIGRLYYLVRDMSIQNCLWLLAGCAATVWSLKETLRDSATYASTMQYHPLRRRIIKRFDQLLGDKTSLVLRCNEHPGAIRLTTEGSRPFERRVIMHVAVDDSGNILDSSESRYATIRIYIFAAPPVTAVIKQTEGMAVNNAGEITADSFDTNRESSWSTFRRLQRDSAMNLLEADLEELTFLAQALDEWDVAEGDLPL